MKTKPSLELADVRRIVAAAEEEAIRNAWKVSIAVCDDGGNPLFLLRMDGASPVSAAVAPEKARTSALTLRPSKAAEEMVNGGRFAALRMPTVPLEGGEPILVDGVCVGGIGVSGVRAAEDVQIARAGLAALSAA